MSIESLCKEWLPINRKERFYTGTILPGIVCQNNFANFRHFLKLVGVCPETVCASPSQANIQFFTEYGFAESIFDAATRDRLRGAPGERDTPDVVILINGNRPVVIAIEAKMFDRVSKGELLAQMNRQKAILDYLALRWPGVQVEQVALLPESLRDELSLDSCRVITWDDILRKYTELDQENYFLGVLRIALDQYETLKSVAPVFGGNADGKLPGKEILARHHAHTLSYKTMGRAGGIDGPLLSSDFQNDRWKSHSYEVSERLTAANRNWFLVESFITKIKQSQGHPGSW